MFEIANYITAIVCLLTAFVIQREYTKEKLRDDTTSVKGIKWFALAIFSWGVAVFTTLNSDAMVFSMMVPNMIGLVVLAPKMVKEFEKYLLVIKQKNNNYIK